MSKRGAGSVIPTGWAKFSWSNLFGPWLMGAAIFIQDARGEFNPIETLEMLHNYPITVLCAPPTAYRMLVLDEPMAYLKSPPPISVTSLCGSRRAAQSRSDQNRIANLTPTLIPPLSLQFYNAS